MALEAFRFMTSDISANFDPKSRFVDPAYYHQRSLNGGGLDIATEVGIILENQLPVGFGQRPTILDIAAGTGVTTHHLKELGYNTIGMDLNPEVLEYSRALKSGPILQADMNKDFPFQTDSIDGAVTVWANRFIKDVPHFAREVHRVLKPNGVFIWPIDPEESLHWKLLTNLFQPTQPSSIRKVLEKVGFAVTEVHNPFWYYLYQSWSGIVYPSAYLVASK